MATCSKRTRLSFEDVLVVLEDRNESNSDRGGMSSGEESDIDRQTNGFGRIDEVSLKYVTRPSRKYFCVFGKRCNISRYLHILSLKHWLSYQEIVQRCIEHFSWVKTVVLCARNTKSCKRCRALRLPSVLIM